MPVPEIKSETKETKCTLQNKANALAEHKPPPYDSSTEPNNLASFTFPSSNDLELCQIVKPPPTSFVVVALTRLEQRVSWPSMFTQNKSRSVVSGKAGHLDRGWTMAWSVSDVDDGLLLAASSSATSFAVVAILH